LEKPVNRGDFNLKNEMLESFEILKEENLSQEEEA